MSTINMIIIKHFKQEVGRSVLDLCLDKDIPGLLSVFPVEVEKSFYEKFGEKNLFRCESDQTELLLLDVMKHLRLNKWNMLTSTSFAHLTLEKTVESHFYFEKAAKPESDTETMQAFATYLRSQLMDFEGSRNRNGYRSSPGEAGFHTPSGKVVPPISPRSRPTAPPEVMALLLDKSSQQSGPYAFAKRSSAAGVSPSKRTPRDEAEIAENFSKIEAEKKAANSRMVQKYQPQRKSVMAVNPKIDVPTEDANHDAEFDQLYSSDVTISEANPLQGGRTPVPPTIQPTQRQPAETSQTPTPVETEVASPAVATLTSTPSAPMTVTAASSSVSVTPSIQPAETIIPLSRPQSAADKLLTKYRRKSSFTKTQLPSTVTAAIPAEETPVAPSVATTAPSSSTPNAEVSNPGSNAGAQTSSIAAALTEALHASSNLSAPTTAAPTPVVETIEVEAPKPEIKKRTSFFNLFNRNSEASAPPAASNVVPNTSIVGVSSSNNNSSTYDSISSAPEAVVPVVTASVSDPTAVKSAEDTVVVEAKKPPSRSTTPTGSRGFLSRYSRKKSGSSNNLKADVAAAQSARSQENSRRPSLSTEPDPSPSVAVDSSSVTQKIEAVEDNHSASTETKTNVQQLSDELTSNKPEEQPLSDDNVTVDAPSSVAAIPPLTSLPAELLQSLPEIPTSSTMSVEANKEEEQTIDATSINASAPTAKSTVGATVRRSGPPPPPPESADVVLSQLEQQKQSQTTTTSLAATIERRVPFSSSSSSHYLHDDKSSNDIDSHNEDSDKDVVDVKTEQSQQSEKELDIKPEKELESPITPASLPPVSVAASVFDAVPEVEKTSDVHVPSSSAVSITPTEELPVSEEKVPQPSQTATVIESSPLIVPIVPTTVTEAVGPAPVPAEAISSSPVPEATPAPVVNVPSSVSSSSPRAASTAASASNADDGYEAYAERNPIPSTSSLMRQISAQSKVEDNPEIVQHESEKTSHYSKLGSAFVAGNALGRAGGAGRGGAGRGRGRGL